MWLLRLVAWVLPLACPARSAMSKTTWKDLQALWSFMGASTNTKKSVRCVAWRRGTRKPRAIVLVSLLTLKLVTTFRYLVVDPCTAVHGKKGGVPILPQPVANYRVRHFLSRSRSCIQRGILVAMPSLRCGAWVAVCRRALKSDA